MRIPGTGIYNTKVVGRSPRPAPTGRPLPQEAFDFTSEIQSFCKWTCVVVGTLFALVVLGALGAEPDKYGENPWLSGVWATGILAALCGFGWRRRIGVALSVLVALALPTVYVVNGDPLDEVLPRYDINCVLTDAEQGAVEAAYPRRPGSPPLLDVFYRDAVVEKLGQSGVPPEEIGDVYSGHPGSDCARFGPNGRPG